MNLLLFITFFSICYANSIVPEYGFTDEKLCNPSGLTHRFTGLRVYSSIVYGFPVRHYWSVIHCDAGVVSSLQYFPCNRTANFMFGEPVELDNGESYIFARKKNYAMRNVPIYRPFTYVGAVYYLDVIKNETEILSPLEADTTASSFTEKNEVGKKITYVPMLYSSFEPRSRGWDFKMTVSPYEYYTYTPEEKKSRWYKVNEFLNTVEEYTYINDRFIPWEFDALEKQIKGKYDWRQHVNNAIPNF